MTIPIYGLYGESHAAPGDTLVSYWAALGAGGSGIVASIRVTEQGELFCGSADNKAGALFTSVELDEKNRPTGRTGSDTPWKKPWRGHPELSSLLQIFGRRTKIMLLLTGELEGDFAKDTIQKLVTELSSFGLEEKVTVIANASICNLVLEQSILITTAMIWEKDKSVAENVSGARQCKARAFFIVLEDIKKDDVAMINNAGLEILVGSVFHAPDTKFLEEIQNIDHVSALIMRSVDRTMHLIRPPSLVLSDSFSGKKINKSIWSCGYSHVNTDTTISQNDGFIISIAAGGDYSGGAAVTNLPIHGDFDAQVDFWVKSPQRATTFELAAIGVDPGYFNIDNSRLNSKRVNLTFDVHGTPPYASSERDEDDGFRIGWNNSHNFVKIDSEWKASSANMFNKYGVDVGNGTADSPSGTLRLTRCGSVFTSYYKDKFNAEWVCSGTALVHNLASDVFIRLAGKHWKKGGIPPENTIIFSNFFLYQF